MSQESAVINAKPTLAAPIKEYGFNTPQRFFVGYTLAVLVDLTVLNLFNEFWQYITVESFLFRY